MWWNIISGALGIIFSIISIDISIRFTNINRKFEYKKIYENLSNIAFYTHEVINLLDFNNDDKYEEKDLKHLEKQINNEMIIVLKSIEFLKGGIISGPNLFEARREGELDDKLRIEAWIKRIEFWLIINNISGFKEIIEYMPNHPDYEYKRRKFIINGLVLKSREYKQNFKVNKHIKKMNKSMHNNRLYSKHKMKYIEAQINENDFNFISDDDISFYLCNKHKNHYN